MKSIIDELHAANALEVPLRQMLQQCCERLLMRLGVNIVGIWVLDEAASVVELQASAGPDARLDEGHERVRVGAFKIGRIAAARLPYLTNSLLDDPTLSSREWARRERLTSFVGCPLMLEKRCVGVVAVFGRTALSHDVVEFITEIGPALASVISQHTAPVEAASTASGVTLPIQGDERFLFLGDAIPHQVWTAAPDGQLTYVNQRVLEYFGRSHQQIVGSGWLDMLHPDDVEECTKRWGLALGSGEPYHFEFRLWSVHTNTYRWHEARALPQRNETGKIVQWYGANTDIDARKRSEDRNRLLLDAGRRLSNSLDAPHILAEIGAICVPHIADWCFIDLQRLDGTCERVIVAHANPARAELAARYYQWPNALNDVSHPSHATLKQGTPRYIDVLTTQQLENAAMNADHRQAQRELGPSSMVVVPLRSIERLVGVVTLVTSVDSGRRLMPEDLEIAEEIGSRAALALENARYISELRAAFAQRERALAEAEFERRSMQRIFEQAPGAICITRGPTHVIQTANALFLETIGKREIVGQTFEHAFPEVVDQTDLVSRINEAFKSGVPYVGHEVSVKLDHGTGTVVEGIFDFVYQPLVDELGSVQGIMIFTVDVTQQVAARKEREAMIEALAQTNTELDEFASVASHDLKAPLRGIATLASWLAESLAPKANEEERAQLELIQNRARRLGALVDGILIYARAGRIRGTKEKVDTKVLVLEILELLGATTDLVQISPNLPTLNIERVLMQQILMNLIGNAIKYTRRTDPRIVVECETLGDGWLFCVKDNGPGIAKEHHAKIWEPFQRLQGRDVVEGTGIGLSVVKKIVESRGGSVSVESAPGEGSTFKVRWPRTA